MNMVFVFIADGKDSKEQGYCSSPGTAQGRYFWTPILFIYLFILISKNDI